MPEHLLVRLEAPLMSFGGTMVGARGMTQRWPAVSMLAGLLGNALGYRRTDSAKLDRLQSRLRWAARLDREGVRLTDFQTVQMSHDDRGWTTRGAPATRAGASYDSPHLRYRDFATDASVLVALRVMPAEEEPTLKQLVTALREPARPLFLGRKCCLPSTPLFEGLAQGADAVDALRGDLEQQGALHSVALFFPEGESSVTAIARHITSDHRRFDIDVHAGQSVVCETVLARGTQS